MEYVSLEGLRLDGRRPKETRRMRCELTALPGSDGSAVFELGNTKVLAAVHGPHECRRPSERLEDSARKVRGIHGGVQHRRAKAPHQGRPAHE